MTTISPKSLLYKIARTLLVLTLLTSINSGVTSSRPGHQSLRSLLPQPSVAYAADVSLPYSETFDSLSPDTTTVPVNWIQVTGDGTDTSCTSVGASCNDWIVDSNGTPSSNTGPTSDHSGSGNYLYVEASGNSNNSVELQSPSINLGGTNSPELTFWAHRYDGNNSGDSHELHIDILTSTGAATIQADALVINNNLLDQNSWVEQIVDLSPYIGNGEIRLQFRWVNNAGGSSWSPDIAIDDIAVVDTNPIALDQISGTVFRDFNADGLRDSNEVGLSGVTVIAYDDAGTAYPASSPTDADGNYTISGLMAGLPYRIEFSGWSADYAASTHGADNGTSLQFTTAGTTGVDLAVNAPCDYCQDNPDIAFVQIHNALRSGAAQSSNTVQRLPEAFTTSSSTMPLATYGEIGAVFGLAYQRSTNYLFAASAMLHYADLGPAGLDGIYVLDESGSIQTTIQLADSFGIDVGPEYPPCATTPLDDANCRDHPVGTSTSSFDTPGWFEQFRIGLGDIDVDDEDEILYAINLNSNGSGQTNGSLVALDIADVSNVSLIGNYPMPNPGCAANSDVRPFALKVYRSEAYVGLVCSAESTQNRADLKAYVMHFDGANFNDFLGTSIPLDYARSSLATWENLEGEFQPWSDDFSLYDKYTNSSGTLFAAYPQPLFADIEFDTDGSLIMAFASRDSFQLGYHQRVPGQGEDLYRGTVGGELLRACLVDGNYYLEGTANCPSNQSGANHLGLNGGEWYGSEEYTVLPDGHFEAAIGTIAQRAGSDLVGTMMDPTAFWENGLTRFVNSTGERVGGGDFVAVEVGATKAGSLGDVELLCDPAPLEIGNFVWYDSDGDGVQDPSEIGIAGLTVELYDMENGGVLVGTTTTDANGEYYFGGPTDANMLTITGAITATISSAISSSSDDAQQIKSNGSMMLTNDDIEVGDPGGTTDSWLGLRFNNLAIPPGATILNAYLQFQTDNSPANTTSSDMTIWGQATDNATTFTNSTNNISTRSRTTSSVSNWSSPQWTTANERGPNQQTPNLAAIVQEIVDRNGWASGNSMAFILDGTGEREAESYDGNSNGAAGLIIEYTYQDSTPQPLLTNRSYEVRVDTTQPALDGLTVSPIGGSAGSGATNDLHDSDATLSGNHAIIALTTGNAGDNDHTFDVGFSIPPTADLVVVKYDDLDPMIAGTLLTYTIIITNNGPNAAENVLITDTLPAGTSYNDASPACAPSGNAVVCTLGTIAANTAIELFISVMVDPTMTNVPACPTCASLTLARPSPIPKSDWINHNRGSPAAWIGVESYGPT